MMMPFAQTSPMQMLHQSAQPCPSGLWVDDLLPRLLAPAWEAALLHSLLGALLHWDQFSLTEVVL